MCANEDGLAAVLGHEVAHQVARHAGERMSSQKVYMAISLVASALGFDSSVSSPAIGLLLTLPNSRAAETEADHVGGFISIVSSLKLKRLSSRLA